MAYKRQPVKGATGLDRAVPKNSKFSHIKSSLNTGSNVNKVKTVTSREYAKRRDEIFYRITKKQLTELFEAYEPEEFENVNNSEYDSPGGPRIVTHHESERPFYEKPYLILDVRDQQSYNTCHLLQARNFPLMLMKRDQMHPDVYGHRNKEEHLIIVYCDDERVSLEAAKFLVDRGTLNVFLLTGGMMEFVNDYADFVEGTIPYPGFKNNMKVQKTPPKRYQKRNTHLHGIGEDEDYDSPGNSPRRYSQYSSPGPHHGRSGSGTHGLTAKALQRHNQMHGSGVGAGSLRSEAGYSNQTGMSVAESVISRATARKGKF